MRLHPFALMGVMRELRRGAGDERPLAVAGARELVPLLARELRAGGNPSAVVEGHVANAAVLVWIGPPDEDALRTASRAGVPIVAVSDARRVPYVLPEAIVRVPRGQGFPVDEISRVVARLLGEDATSLAARLPVLRPAVVDQLTRHFARRNGLISAAIFVPGVDMPVLTLNQIRLVLRIALAHGEHIDRDRAVELLGVVGAGFGMRAVARQLLNAIPLAGWAVKGAIAFAGTKAIGAAAHRYFEAKGPSGPGPTLS